MKDKTKRMSLPKKFEKMLSLGLWPPDLAQPDPQILERIQRLNEDIEAQYYKLYLPDGEIKQQKEEILKKYRQEKTSEPKKEIREKQDRKEWIDFKKNNFVHLGNGVSTWLNDRETDIEQLETRDLPLLTDAASISDFFNLTIKQIKWYAYHREYTDYINYIEFEVPKVSGGTRNITKPRLNLSKILDKIKTEILDKLSFESFVHGFVKNHSIYQNAREHAKSNIIVNIDIKNFFENVNFYQVRSAFNSLGYSGEISTVLALLTTKQHYNKVNLENNDYWHCSNSRYLPQGASTSPGISNLVAKKIDNQLYQRSRDLGFIYTRYADDLTFSTSNDEPELNTLLYMARKTLELHGFEANPNKTKILDKSDQQRITGLVVNSNAPKVPRKWRRKLRAAVHQFQFLKDPEEQEKEYYRIMGCLQHLKLSHPRKAVEYKRTIDRYFTPVQ